MGEPMAKLSLIRSIGACVLARFRSRSLRGIVLFTFELGKQYLRFFKCLCLRPKGLGLASFCCGGFHASRHTTP
eukprot:scaffold174637_cov31-Tisochrysis_lutea.AAC.6